MRVIFMGTPAFAVPTLDAVVEAGHEVLAVVAQPDKPAGRGNVLQSPATIERARALGLPTRQPKAVRSGAFPEWMESAGADVAVVVAYGRILTPRLLAAPKLGCVNVHASLLPKYRGAAPIQWAVVRGESETGVTTMRMDEGLDTGDMLLTARLDIGPDETAGELSVRLAALGAGLLVETLARLDEITPVTQDHAAATLAPLLSKDDGRIDWARPASELHNQVRGLQPWPGAWTVLRGDSFKIVRSRPRPDLDVEPGALLLAGGLFVGTGAGALEILEGQLPGKRVASGRDLINGARLNDKEKLG